MADFRILSLDGGGTWALIQVLTLIDFFGDSTPGHEVLKSYDLVAANSGGAIVLGGLAKNMTLGQLRDLFVDPDHNQRDKIFVTISPLSDPVYYLTHILGIGPKYSTQGKLAGLKTILGPAGEQMMTDLPAAVGSGKSGREPQFVICAFDYDLNREVFFRSDTGSLSSSFTPARQATLVQAIHASSNAPVEYFDAPAKIRAHRYWDGGIGGYNNPVLAGAIEAVTNASRYDTTADEIQVLSLGTGSVVLPLETHAPHEDPTLVQHQEESGFITDLQKLATSIVDDPPDAATFHAHVLLGGAMPADAAHPFKEGSLVRMNPLVQPFKGSGDVPWVLPTGLNAQQFSALCGITMDAIKQEQMDLIETLAQAWLDSKVHNQPIRVNHDTLEVEIGDRWYRDARNHAQRLGLI